MKTAVCIVIALYVIIISWNLYEMKHAHKLDDNDPNF